MIDGPKRGFMQFQDVRSFLDSVLSEDIHAKRVDSLANAALGVMTGASLAVAMIGRSLAQARGLLTKHAVKQVDRLLSNPGIEAWDIFATWVPEMVGSRTDIVVAMDWTDYDADGQATLALKLVTRHGRATPLVWLSVHKDELTDARNAYEDAALCRLAEVLPAGVKVGPVHRHHDVGARPDHLRDPRGEDVPRLDPRIAQQPVDLLDGVLGQKAAGLGQRPANHRDGQRGACHHPERGIGKRIDPLRMNIFRKNAVEKTPDKGAFYLQSPMHQRVFVPENCI